MVLLTGGVNRTLHSEPLWASRLALNPAAPYDCTLIFALVTSKAWTPDHRQDPVPPSNTNAV